MNKFGVLMSLPPVVIVFDLGNVLIPFDYDIIIDKLQNVEEGLGKKFYKKYKDNYDIHRKYEKWELTNDEFLDIILDWLEHKVTKEEFCNIYSNIFEENSQLSGLLPKLKENYRLVLLSNTNDIHRKYGWGKYGFLQNFEKLILSHEVGAVKPEAQIYQAVMDYTKRRPEEHFFIDDIAEYVEGAKKVGWDAVQYAGFQNLLNDFKIKGIKYE